MMRWNDFGRSLLFGAVAAAAFVPFAIVAAPHLGWGATLAAYAVVSAAAYLAGLGATRRQGLGAGLVVGLLGTGVALAAPTPRDAILAAALLLGLCRSGLLYRARFARALVRGGVLLCAGLGIAGHLLTGSTFSAVLAVWAFFLVQSVFFLVGGVEIRHEETRDADPFDAAHARAVEILEQGVGEAH
jgi:hypothetical protein